MSDAKVGSARVGHNPHYHTYGIYVGDMFDGYERITWGLTQNQLRDIMLAADLALHPWGQPGDLPTTFGAYWAIDTGPAVPVKLDVCGWWYDYDPDNSERWTPGVRTRVRVRWTPKADSE
jgi:hypothetical protein